MVKQIISANEWKTKASFKKDGGNFLNVSEFFYDTVQGEGVYTGHPAAFLRLKDCTLNCRYCDTTEVWKRGLPYSFNEIFERINSTMLIPKLTDGMHLVITGGSPLLQQERLGLFLILFRDMYGFKPFIEIENECTKLTTLSFQRLINCWNNSPKLSDSGVSRKKRYYPAIIQRLSTFDNSWFKFVVSCEEDWEEIKMDFLDPGLIGKEQVILMPKGATREELEQNRETVVNMSIRYGVRYSDRLHIQIWDNKIGV